MSDRELDAQVAERVMEWTGFTHNGRIGYPPDADPNHVLPSVVPHYSESIEAAMEVVEKMRADGWSFACTLYQGELPYASFCKRTAVSSRNAEADILPEAICRAALAAISSGVEQGAL